MSPSLKHCTAQMVDEERNNFVCRPMDDLWMGEGRGGQDLSLVSEI